MNQLLKQYSSYYNVPVQQLTSTQIAQLLAQQATWATNTQVSGYIQGNQVTITNGGAAAKIPLTGITTVGTTYGGTQSGWTSEAAGSTTYTAQSTWPAPGAAQAPQGGWVGQLGTKRIPAGRLGRHAGRVQPAWHHSHAGGRNPHPVGGKHHRRPRAAGAGRQHGTQRLGLQRPERGHRGAEVHQRLHRRHQHLRGRLGQPGPRRDDQPQRRLGTTALLARRASARANGSPSR